MAKEKNPAPVGTEPWSSSM